jgi:hypothetical protein
MAVGQQWTSDGEKTGTSDPFRVNLGDVETTYTVKTEVNITGSTPNSPGNVSQSKLTLQDTVPGRSGTEVRALATSTDGGKTWIPEKDSQGKSLLDSTQLAALYPGNKLYTATRSAAKIDAKLKGASDKQIQQLDNGNAASTPSAGISTSASGPSEAQKNLLESESKDILQRQSYESVVYPIGLDAALQDCIKFSIVQYKQSGLKEFGQQDNNLRIVSVNRGNPTIKGREKQILATIVLPIPGGIQDTNQVNWSDTNFNPLMQGLGSLVQTAIQGEDVSANAQRQLDAAAAAKNELRKGVITSFTESALQTSGVMQRQFGTIINPNMELLFNSPYLRTFSFSFKLSPRSSEEAVIVKKTIRNFKQAMSVKKSASSFLLQTPHTFAISYIFQNQQHPYLNKFKECALTSCSVNYTPEGNYMSFDDSNQPSMVSYQLDLQFQELEPLYDNDYGDDYNNIGY